MSILRLSLLVVGLVIVGTLCAGPAAAQWSIGGVGGTAAADPNQPSGAVGGGADPNRPSGPLSITIDPNQPRVIPMGVPMDPNIIRYWSDPNQLTLKDSLVATDEEWPALGPRIKKVQTLQAQLRPRRGGISMGAIAMWGVGPAASAEPSELDQAYQALTKVLADKGSDGEIKSALQTLRQVRAKVKADLEKAQKELKELLTVRQEAILKQQGLFD
jgi:hypothetical protein